MALALLAAGGVAATLLGLGTAGAGGPSSVETVREQNVDAQGNIKVAEQGTPSVSLTGSPRVGLEPTLGNTVKIDPNANTVKIDPAGTGPIETQSADNPAFSPVVTGAFHAFDGVVAQPDLYTVPSGSELVIEQIAAEVEVPAGQTIETTSFMVYPSEAGGPIVVFPLPTTSTALPADSLSIGDMQTRLYAPPGSSVFCEGLRSDSSGSAGMSCSISGYLVPAK